MIPDVEPVIGVSPLLPWARSTHTVFFLDNITKGGGGNTRAPIVPPPHTRNNVLLSKRYELVRSERRYVVKSNARAPNRLDDGASDIDRTVMVVATEIIRCDANTLRCPHAIFYHMRIDIQTRVYSLATTAQLIILEKSNRLSAIVFFHFPYLLPFSHFFFRSFYSFLSVHAYYSSPKAERPVLSVYFPLLPCLFFILFRSPGFFLLLHPLFGFSVSLFLLLSQPLRARASVRLSFFLVLCALWHESY